MLTAFFRAALVSTALSSLLAAAPAIAVQATSATSAAPVTITSAKLDAVLPVGPQVKVGKLANGLTYYIQKNTKPARKLELRLVVKAGSILEDEDQQGLAHFTEHMAFNGSTNFKKHELVSWLQSIGVKFGADLNAYTSFDETVYILPIPTDRKEDIDKGFLVLQDWAGGLSMRDADIDKERDIILEELRLGKGAGDRMNKVLMPKIFNGSRYAPAPADWQGRDHQGFQAGRIAPLLPGLVSPGPDGRDGGGRCRPERHRAPDQKAFWRAAQPGP